jgi:hypothetical protein
MPVHGAPIEKSVLLRNGCWAAPRDEIGFDLKAFLWFCCAGPGEDIQPCHGGQKADRNSIDLESNIEGKEVTDSNGGSAKSLFGGSILRSTVDGSNTDAQFLGNRAP